MIKNLKTRHRFSHHYSSLSLQPTLLPHFCTEQSSCDYIVSLCKKNLYKEALQAFDFLQKDTSSRVNICTYANLICASSSLRSLEYGRRIHNHMLSSSCVPDVILQNHIVNMYGKCGSLKDARKVFDEMPERNLVSWTSVIAGYSQNGNQDEAMKLYLMMLKSGVMPDHFTFGSVIKACFGVGDVELGKQLHAHVVKSEYGSQLIAQNALIALYVKFDRIGDARDVFSRIMTKDLISWGSMITGFSQLGYELEALNHFKEMLSHAVYKPNEFILGSAFSACSSILQPEYGRQIHGLSIKFGLRRNIYVGCSLCHMYAKCGILESARSVFYQIERPDLVSWNAIIAGYASYGDSNEALRFFSQMRHLGLVPDGITILSLLCACMNPSALYQGMQLHSYIVKMGFDFDVAVCNSLLTMYAKCSTITDAFNVFEENQHHADVVSWNSIVTACMQHNHAEEVVRLFKLMLVSQIKPDHTTLTNSLGAYADIGSLQMGNQIHCYTMKTGLVFHNSVTNGLIDMYTKCGSLRSAQKLFDWMVNPDVVSWSSLIVGYAQFGYGEEALKLYRKMRSQRVKPNEVTIVGVLTACSHVGLVQEGLQLYRTMETEHGILQTREHCSCVVDMLARAGYLYDAEIFINKMPFDPDIVVWKTLLAACKTRRNAEIGKWAAENILKIDPSNSAALVLLCNIYAACGYWEDVARLRSLMKQRGVLKVPGQSWIEVKKRMHTFLAEDHLHPEREKIYAFLEELWLQMLDTGYVPFQY